MRNREEGRSRDMHYLTGNKHCIKLQLYSVKPVTLLGALVLRGALKPVEEEDRRDEREEVGEYQ